MNDAARKLVDEALALNEHDRLEVASEILASVDGPGDAAWEDTWAAELRQRDVAGARAADWADARSRILSRLRPAK
jgi:hypothetical protein